LTCGSIRVSRKGPRKRSRNLELLRGAIGNRLSEIHHGRGIQEEKTRKKSGGTQEDPSGQSKKEKKEGNVKSILTRKVKEHENTPLHVLLIGGRKVLPQAEDLNIKSLRKKKKSRYLEKQKTTEGKRGFGVGESGGYRGKGGACCYLL